MSKRLTVGDLDTEGNMLFLGGWNANILLTPEDKYVVISTRVEGIKPFYTDSDEKALEAWNWMNGMDSKPGELRKIIESIRRHKEKDQSTKEIVFSNPSYRVMGRFSSESKPGIVYEVRENKSGSLYCTCPGYSYRRTCRHVDLVKIGNEV